MTSPKTCAFCGDPFEPVANRQKYCQPPKTCAHYAKLQKDRESWWRTSGKSPKVYDRRCPVCMEMFETNRKDKIMCGPKCKKRYDLDRANAKNRAKREKKRTTKICTVCGADYYNPRYNSKFCGDACRKSMQMLTTTLRTCPCGNTFEANKGHGFLKFCSVECRYRYGRKGLHRYKPQRGVAKKIDANTMVKNPIDKTAAGVYYSESDFWNQLRSIRRGLDREERMEGDYGYQCAIETYGTYTTDGGVQRPLHLENTGWVDAGDSDAGGDLHAGRSWGYRNPHQLAGRTAPV